ncbi:MAG: RNA-guided endonuclease TnpB family protein [Methanomicrobiales archaeon]|nr:RNA-guided endonuclease TnpB family protein [Methanomicrobiales archaeon]
MTERISISLVHDVEEKEYTDNGLYQAWDLGISKQVGVNLEGKFIQVENPRPDKYWKKPLAEVQSRRDYCKKGSRKWCHLNEVKRRIERKKSNQIMDFQHKCSAKIVNNTRANIIIIGDLSVKDMAQSEKATKGINRATQGTGYLGRFAGFLTYKAEQVGKKVIEISERKTSKTCCVCGKEHDMPIWERIMECDCGTVLDRDRNSAINIMVQYLSQKCQVDGLPVLCR